MAEVDLAELRPVQGALILVVEDNEINQQVAMELLEQAGFRVEIANHGQEAVDKIANTSYDCVLMDVQMPIMDGYTATKKIREDQRFSDLPILAMTANATVEDREQALKIGMNRHFRLPGRYRTAYRHPGYSEYPHPRFFRLLPASAHPARRGRSI